MSEADLIIALGVRFDDRATGMADKFCPNASIIHIDIDRSEINKIKKSNLSVVCDANTALENLNPLIDTNVRADWMAYIESVKAAYPFIIKENKDEFYPVNLIRKISGMVNEDTIITTDVGQHQMWVAQSYPFKKPRTLLTSGGLGTMGFGLPAAIGAALANPDKKVVCFSGDGSILMNIQEIATLADLNLNITIILMNNGHLGLVRQQQELFYQQNYIASKFIKNPDFAAIGRAFGIKGYDLDGAENPMDLLNESLSRFGPSIVNVPINWKENVLPMVPPGAANHEAIDICRSK